ncbi:MULTISPECIES: hypothetical protein [Pseudomonas syringae group]|uniref:Uncharacterized protein n=8 Tax=Pseudomonas syringae group TaxID=136849 RepID=A0A2K4X3L3_PSESX|nr:MULTISPECIES: hypothetical protein [Pseudomonas syringae group]RML30434.1 hypothetical protein ALQ97_200133 [Pseudomonas savastanoi pv. glycinea]AVB12273.1 hypothetical protein BKM19_000425 [Pseudomonas amygdali pv. morsprunorum]KWS65938.1 hypothetical protein AL054_25415 [Pseudomonas amygdali pv. morsprunorum]MDT3227796.1 hypothetical protein [Pseudomonas amygdali pv. morsprunorum]MDT3244608.1 hypothetical protein [Pseudomonas amygdali pv. morsprunorum]
MKLYHYTSVPLAGVIFNTELKGSPYRTQDGRTVGPCVWLTTSPSPLGHGLLTGEKLTPSNVEYLKRIGRPPKNLTTHKKTLVRIQIESESLSKWALESSTPSGLIPYVKFSKLLGESKLWRKSMGLSCYYDLKALSDEELVRHYKKTKTMEETWWLNFDSIPAELIEAVAFQTQSGYVPYDFEEHGRAQFEDSGLYVAPKPLLDEFHELCPPLNRFDTPQATVFCASADSRPTVAFQARGAAWDIDLEALTISTRIGPLPSNISEIVGWVDRHRNTLLGLWPAAVDTYNRYYPDLPAELPSKAI